MINSKHKLIDQIKAFMDQNGERYGSFYVGITSNPFDRFIAEHHVSLKDDLWAYYPTLTPNVAHEVKKYLIEQLGTEGFPDGLTLNSKYIYVYQKTPETNP